MAEEKEIVLINKAGQLFTINFMGAFPINKWANPDGKYYLTPKEYDFVKANYSHILGKQLVHEGEEGETYNQIDEVSPDAFFTMHHTKQKAAIKEMSDEKLQELLEYADLNEINKKIVKEIEDQYLQNEGE